MKLSDEELGLMQSVLQDLEHEIGSINRETPGHRPTNLLSMRDGIYITLRTLGVFREVMGEDSAIEKLARVAE